MVYDSSTYLLKSIAYFYNTTYSSPQCDISTSIDVPSSGITMPAAVTPDLLIRTYKNFLAEFPGHTKGATVRIYLDPSQPVASVQENTGNEWVSATPSTSINEVESTVATNTIAVNNYNPINRMSFAGDAFVESEKNAFEPVNQHLYSKQDLLPEDSTTPPQPRQLLKSVYANGGRYVDSVMNSLQLFEWYMNQHLTELMTGKTYKAEVYIDWLVNRCNYKIYQYPWMDMVAVPQDTLQNIWTRFSAKYPVSQLTINETVNVPIVKGIECKDDTKDTNGNIKYQGYTDNSYEITSFMTWTNGGWYVQRGAFVYDLSVLPKNATINTAYLNLYAFKYSWYTAAHFRYYDSTRYTTRKNPYMVIQPVKGVYIPGKTTFSTQPEIYTGMPVVNCPALSVLSSGGPGGDFWSNQDYTNQNITSLVAGMYFNIKSVGINYPVQYRVDNEENIYKLFEFGGTECSNASKRPVLNVTYTAPRAEVFAAWVNNALGTYLTYDQVKDLYKNAGNLEINSNCTGVVYGLGCITKPITGVTTITLNNTGETEYDMGIFGESRFFYRIGNNYYPQPDYSGYSVIPLVGDEN